MRHQAGDDVVVVSRPSLTKSLLWVPVRPRSPGWTRESLPHLAYRVIVFFVSSLAQWNTNSAKIASWIRRGIEAEGGCCCQPWGRVSLGVCGNNPPKCSVLYLGYRADVQLLYFPMEIILPYGTLRLNGPGLEKCFDRRKPIRKDREIRWVRAIAARTLGSVIPFDTFDRWRLGREFTMIDWAAWLTAADHVAVPQVVDRRDADATLASSTVKAEIIR